MSAAARIPDIFPVVDKSESGQKLLRFLERRLPLPRSLFHRWIRTGQIRVNGKRCRPSDRVNTGDIVRLPPFAMRLAEGDNESSSPVGNFLLPPLIGQAGDILAFDKPYGLPVQGGTGQALSLADMLKARYAGSPFIPAPAHRLDRHTTGIVLAGASYAALRKLHTAFVRGTIHKEYLAWIRNVWPEAMYLRHYFRLEKIHGRELQSVKDTPAEGHVEGACYIRPILAANGATLAHIRLDTGRKHQIRAQLAHMGSPVIGDGKYGVAGQTLKLHAMRVILPDGESFACLPPWTRAYAVNRLPAPLPARPAPWDI